MSHDHHLLHISIKHFMEHAKYFLNFVVTQNLKTRGTGFAYALTLVGVTRNPKTRGGSTYALTLVAKLISKEGDVRLLVSLNLYDK